MDNGSNNWFVPYSSIAFFEKILRTHQNVAHLERTRDIMFTITRINPSDCMSVLVVNTYTFGVADFYKAKEEFPDLTCIVLAGDWNAYTRDAKELADAENVGLLIPRELVAAIWREKPNRYFTKDAKGNPVYHVRAA